MRYLLEHESLQLGEVNETGAGQGDGLTAQFWYGLKGGGHNIFKAVNLPTNWLKIPKSVNATDIQIQNKATSCTQMLVELDGREFLHKNIWTRKVNQKPPTTIDKAHASQRCVWMDRPVFQSI